MNGKIRNSQFVIRNLKFLLVNFILLLDASTGWSQTLPLDSVLSRIERSNPGLLSYENKILSEDELVNSARAWMPPMVSYEFGKTPYKMNLGTSGFPMEIAVEQAIPNTKKLNAKENYLKSVSVISKSEKDFYKYQLFTEAKKSYYKRAVSEMRIEIIKENISNLELMISLSEKKLGITNGNLGEIYALKAKLTTQQTMLVHEENMIKSQTVTLNYLMNEDVSKKFSLDTNELIKDYSKDILSVIMDSVTCRRSDIMKMNNEISSMKLNQKVMASKKYPDFAVRALHEQGFNGIQNRFAIMGSITIPIVPWSAKEYKSETKAMQYSIDGMEQQKQNMTNMAYQMVKMLLIELESEYTELDNYTSKVIPAYKKSLDANLFSFGQNTNEFIMTLNAWSDLQMAQMEYLRHLDTLFDIQAEYEKEMQIR